MATVKLCTFDDIMLSPAMDKLRRATADQSDQEYVELLIGAVSDTAERLTGRKFKLDTYTETFTVSACRRSVQLSAFPVVSVTSVKESYTGDFPSGTTWDAGNYGVIVESGVLKLRGFEFYSGVESVQVVYTGGYDATQIPLDLRVAVIDQVTVQFKRAADPHLVSQGELRNVATYHDTHLLPHVAATLRRYSIINL